jgi:hypothetical protein
MSSIIITMSRTIFFRLLAHAPEELRREAKEDARRAIPALCFTEDDIRERLAQEEMRTDALAVSLSEQVFARAPSETGRLTLRLSEVATQHLNPRRRSRCATDGASAYRSGLRH